MKPTKIVKKIFKRSVNIPAWIGYKQLAATTKEFAGVIKNTFTAAEPLIESQKESFEEAMARLQLTEQGLKQRIKFLTFFSVFWLVLSLGVLAYGIYLAEVGTWYSFVACVAITLVCLAQAFRYNFWLFQMKQRRLGCTFQDWLNGTFTGNNS